MPSYVTPKINTEFIFYCSLVSQSDTKVFQANPTLAAGDVKVSTDGAAEANIGTLPVVTPAGSKRVKVTLSASEMNGDNTQVTFSDAAGAEWCDLTVNIQTSARQVDDLAFPATSGRSLGVETDGHVHGDIKEWLGVAPAALDTQRVQTHVAAMAANVLTATAINADAITAAKIAANAIGASELATDAVNEIRDAILSDSTAFAGANIDAALSTLATPTDVNVQVSDVIKTDTIAELTGIADAAATPTLEKAIMLVYMWLRNNTQATATERRILNDDGTEIMDATMSDDGTTFQQGKLTAP